MQRVKCFAAIAAAACIACCSPADEARESGETDCRSFTLAGVALAIDVPKGSAFETAEDGNVVRIVPRPSTRLVHEMTLRVSPGASMPPGDTTVRIEAGGTLTYSVSPETSGGSGGPEGEIFGEIHIPDVSIIYLSCRDQQEGSADPEWCLDHVRTLTRASARSGCH